MISCFSAAVQSHVASPAPETTRFFKYAILEDRLVATIVYRQQHGGQMSEDELQELVETVAEAHAASQNVA